jgi:quinol monooxygenase YgiN
MVLEMTFIDCPKQCRCEPLNGLGHEGYGPKNNEGTFMELAIEIKAKPGNFQELDQTLQALLPTIRNEKGCRECHIYRDMEDGAVFFLSGQWEAQRNLEHFMGSANGMALLGAIEVLSESAAVKTGQDAAWEGIDVLKRMRKKT